MPKQPGEDAPKPKHRAAHTIPVQILKYPYELPDRLKDAEVDKDQTMHLSLADAVYAKRNLSWVNIDFSQLTAHDKEALAEENVTQ